jgi:hypothetical protein
MSKLMRIIESKFTGIRRPAGVDIQQEFVFQFLWRNRFFCRPRELMLAKANVIRQFKADIFADVDRLIIEGRQAAIEGDTKKVLEVFDKIEDEL